MVTRLYDAELRDAGLEVTQFGVLSALDHLGEASHARLAAGFGMDGTTVTRTVGVLERRGLVIRRVGDDRRRRVYALTPEGRAALAAARPGWQRAQDRVRAVMGDGPWTAIMTAATSVSARLRRGDSPRAASR